VSEHGEGAAKVCVVCGCDCNGIPRTKDKRGRYFCQPCYQRAIALAKARRLQAAAAAREADLPSVMEDYTQPAPVDSGLGDLMGLEHGTPIETKRTCAACGAVLPHGQLRCSCGGPKPLAAKPAATKAGSAGVSMPGLPTGLLANPWIIALGITVVLGAMFLIGRSNPQVMTLYVGIATLFCLAIGIWTLVCAFQTSAGTGVLCLCLPPYTLYFVYGKSGSRTLQAMYTAALCAGLLNCFAQQSLLRA